MASGKISESCGALVRELRQSFDAGTTKSYKWRVHQLKMVNKFLDEKEAQIVEALKRDLCKPDAESYVAEMAMLRLSCQHVVKNLTSWMKPRKAAVSLLAMPGSAEIVPEPLGVVLIISAWNYPLLLAIDPLIGSIAAGNAAVIKPSEVSPATSSLLASFVSEYLDNASVRVVEGAAEETTALLEQKWDKIFFTGSGRIGRIVMAAAAKHLTPVSLELGGKCPVIVDSNTDLKVESFQRALVSFYGDNQLESRDLSRIVNLNHFRRLTKLLDDERVCGKIVHGGERDEKQLRIAPTLLLDVPLDSLIMQEEIFGPLLPIITVDKIEDSFDVIKLQPKPLAAYLFTKDKWIEKTFVDRVSVGGMIVANPSLPFGGVGDSGMGAYHGKHSFDAFSHMKPVLYRSFVGEVAARYPPYTDRKVQILKCLLTGDIVGFVGSLFRWYWKKD